MTALQSNRLAVLAGRLAAAHGQCLAHAKSSAKHAIEAGHILLEAKSALAHGHWLPWLRDHVGMSERSAQTYMRLARSGLKCATVADLGLRAALAATATKRVPIPKAGQYLLGKADEDPDKHDSHIVFAWPSAAAADHLHAVLLQLPAGAGAPHEVVGTAKPFASGSIADVLKALRFPTCSAVFSLHHTNSAWFIEDLHCFAITGESRMFGRPA